MAKKKPTEKKVVLVEWSIGIGFANATRRGEWELDYDDWESLTPAEREKWLGDMLQDEVANYLDAGYGTPILPEGE